MKDHAHRGERVDRFSNLSPEARDKVLKTAFYGDVPHAVFFMMPLFALHTDGFAFLAMTLLMVLHLAGIGLAIGAAVGFGIVH